MDSLENVLNNISSCTICSKFLPLGPRPIVTASRSSKIAIIGQAPGTKVHASGIPWDDQSGKQLRKWLGVTSETFYNTANFAILPMGFCYPGKGKSGDLPPREECAPKWHTPLLQSLPNIQLKLLVGKYAQEYYLKLPKKQLLTETISNYKKYLPNVIVLPHPSPRNRFWLSKNPWFQEQVVPQLAQRVAQILHKD